MKIKTALPIAVFLALMSSPAFAVSQSVTCKGEVVNIRNVKSVMEYVGNAYTEHAFAVNTDGVSFKDAIALSGHDALSAAYQRDLNALKDLAKSNFSETSIARAINVVGGSDMCAANYTCGTGPGSSVGTSAHCSTCNYVEVTPATNPRTCTVSCKMCCAHFGNPSNCNCDVQDPC